MLVASLAGWIWWQSTFSPESIDASPPSLLPVRQVRLMIPSCRVIPLLPRTSENSVKLDFSHLGAKRAGVLVAQPPQGRGARGTHALLCLRSWQGSSRGSETGHPEAPNPLFWAAPFGHVSSPPPPAPRRRSRPL